MRYFTSDHHFGHENILHLGEGRPFNSLNHMHTEIINRHNSLVTWDDEVYYLGDIAMGFFEKTIELFQRMNGVKYFIPGNHDKIFSSKSNQKRIDTFTLLYEEAGLTILPEITSIIIDNQEVLLSHFPYRADHVGGLRFEKNRPVDTGLPLIHGHTHQRSVFFENPREYHVGVDAHNYYPVPETEIITWLNDLRNKKLI